MDCMKGVSALDAARSFEALGALGERLGGIYSLAGAYLLETAGATRAARLARRNELIVRLKERHYAEASNLAAAKTIYRDIRHYAASQWKRRDAKFDAPPLAYLGTFRELLFRILEASERAPGVATIRRVLDEARVAKIRGLPNGNLMSLPRSATGARGAAVSETNVIEIIKSIPEFRAAAAEAQAKTVADRQRLLDAIAKLDGQAAKDYAPRRKREAQSIASVREAERALKVANAAHAAVMGALSRELHAYEVARRAAEAELIAGDWPDIVAFVAFCDEEWERTRKSQTVFAEARRNERTGKTDRVEISNGAAVKARLDAVMQSRRSAWDLRMIADPRDLPARIAEIKEGWPRVAHPAAHTV